MLELQGEAPRALAWVVHGLTVPADAEEPPAARSPTSPSSNSHWTNST